MQTKLPTLDLIDQLQVASPCHVSWDSMKGDERSRYCLQCKLQVHNISGMSREEALRLVEGAAGQMCVRFYRRADGTVLTRDCPVGLRAVRHRLTRAIGAIAAMFVALITGAVFAGRHKSPSGAEPTGPAAAYAEWMEPEIPYPLIIGAIAIPPNPQILPNPTGTTPFPEPAETPLPEPTPEQLQDQLKRLQSNQ